MIELRQRLELFVDDHVIDRLTGLHLMMHHPQPREVVLEPNRPWEGPASGYFTVLKTAEKYLAYYRGLQFDAPTPYTCLAQSQDGIHFERPSLGLVEFDGSKDNNIILAGPAGHNFAPFIDTRPGVPGNERFKAFGSDLHEKTKFKPPRAYCSEDGIHWRLMQEKPVMVKGVFDSQNVAFWSELEGCYVSYFRTWSQGFPYNMKGRRTISRATSDDFLNWSDPVAMDFGGATPEEYYTNQTHPYFRAPHIYLAFPKRFVDGRAALSEEEAASYQLRPQQRTAASDGVMMSSRGGNRYDHLFPEAFLRPGRDRANWAARSNTAASNIIPTAEDEMSMYYQHRYATPTTYIRRYVLRTDGVASLHAPYHGGEMLTRVISFTGQQLLLNYATSAHGTIRVELQEPSGEPIEGCTLNDCEEIFGDHIARAVRWQGKASVSDLVGRPVRVRFVMHDADLYSYQFAANA